MMLDVKPPDYDIESLEAGEAVAVDWTGDMYFEDRRALTRSSLGLMPGKPRALRKWLDGESRDTESTAKSLGTLTHMAALEPARFMSLALPAADRPEIADGRAAHGTPGRVAWEQWQVHVKARAKVLAANSSALDISARDRARITGMISALFAHAEAAVILNAQGYCEQTIVWREPTTGLLAKVRVDKLMRLGRRDVFGTNLDPGDVVFDLKTTDDDAPRPFLKSAWRHGCIPQAALYTDAVEALLGRKPQWIFGAVTQAPTEEQNHGVSVYTMTDEQLGRGREIYRNQMIAVMERRDSNDWTPSHRRGVQLLPM
jgi:hypothetical protein